MDNGNPEIVDVSIHIYEKYYVTGLTRSDIVDGKSTFVPQGTFSPRLGEANCVGRKGGDDSAVHNCYNGYEEGKELFGLGIWLSEWMVIHVSLQAHRRPIVWVRNIMALGLDYIHLGHVPLT